MGKEKESERNVKAEVYENGSIYLREYMSHSTCNAVRSAELEHQMLADLKSANLTVAQQYGLLEYMKYVIEFSSPGRNQT